MATRDHYSIRYKCPKCGKEGAVDYSDNDYPFMKSKPMIESMPEGFSSKKSRKPWIGYDITCNDCGVEVV